MCTGLEIALLVGGAAAATGGTLLQRSETQKNAAAAAHAKNEELALSRKRLRGFEDKSRQEGVQKALAKFDPAEQAKAQDEATTRRGTAIEEAIGAEPIIGDIPLEGAPEIVKGDIGKRLRDVFNNATAHAKLAAKPLTWNDTLMGNNVALGEAGRIVDTQNAFARQEAAMLPNQQEFAAFASQKNPSVWGPVLQAAGQAAAGAGGSGYFRAAAPAIGAATAAAAPAAGVYASPWADLGLRSAPA